MALTPENASEELIAKLFDDELKPARTLQAAFDRIDAMSRPEPTSVPELFFHTKKRDDRYEFDPAPGGWYCRGKNYDGPESPLGWGRTQKDALTHYLDQAEPELPATSAERELDEAIDDALFDADLEDRSRE